MKTYVIGELVTAGGHNLKRSWSPAVPTTTWVIPGAEVRSVQAPTIPLRLEHGGPAVGQITHLERRASGSVWCVAETDLDLQQLPNDNLYLSVEASWDEGVVGRDVEIRGAAFAERSCMIGLWPCTIVRSGLNQHGRSIDPSQRELIERAGRGRHHGDPLIVHDTTPSAEPHNGLAVRAAPPVEIRSAEQVGISTTARTIELVVAPYEQPANVHHKGRWIKEVYTRGAFKDIHKQTNRVRINRDHDPARTCGRAIAFHPRRPEGLVAEIRIARTALGDESLALAAEDCLSASAGFRCLEERWQGRDTRLVAKAWLDHIALTPSPAYETADVLAVRGTY